VEGASVGRVTGGVLVLLGVLRGDAESDADRLAERVARFRYFPDEEGRMNRGLSDAQLGPDAGALVVSQFTLAADGRKGRRPSFDRAAPPEEAERLYTRFVERLRAHGIRTETGRFGAAMEVELVNTGPVTFVLDEPAGGPAPEAG